MLHSLPGSGRVMRSPLTSSRHCEAADTCHVVTTAAPIELRNCPFHAVARDHTEVLCGLNLGLVEGVLPGWGDTDAHADLDPYPNRCCVVITPTT